MSFAPANTLSFTKEELVVAVCRGNFGSHIGIAFHSAKEGMKLLHLRSHLDLKTDDFPPERPNCWVATVINLPAPLSKQMVAIVRSVSKRLPHINYGINFLAAAGSFDAQGHYKAPKGSDGLTCSTFVSTIFRDSKIPLIQEHTWESSPENIAWGEAICEWLSHHADESHVEAVKRNIKGLRVRPEEVAAAADTPFPNRPVIFSLAKASAPAVMVSLKEACAEL